MVFYKDKSTNIIYELFWNCINIYKTRADKYFSSNKSAFHSFIACEIVSHVNTAGDLKEKFKKALLGHNATAQY